MILLNDLSMMESVDSTRSIIGGKAPASVGLLLLGSLEELEVLSHPMAVAVMPLMAQRVVQQVQRQVRWAAILLSE